MLSIHWTSFGTPLKFGTLALLLGLPLATAWAAGVSTTQPVRQMVTRPVDVNSTVELSGNVRPEASGEGDQGQLDGDVVLDHVQLLLRRPPETEAALESYLAQLQDKASPNYRRWLSADQLQTQYGPNPADHQLISAWLASYSLTVNGVGLSGMVIDFSGTAAQVSAAFGTQLHVINARNASHMANVSNPRIPAALAEVVKGVVSLHDFRPRTHFKARGAYTFSSNGSTYQAVVPADLATIYNLNPLFASGVSGQGQTIVVIEDTNVYSVADWSSFRAAFGLSAYTAGSFSQVHPAPAHGNNNCGNPGVVAGNEMEAELDAEWASAAAPSAAIVLASCRDTRTTFGGLIALQNLLGGSKPPAIVSISYGECEAMNGATANAAYSTTYQTAAAEGVSVFVSSGDEGAASCDANQANATHGIGVSGFASTPYNVAVGGTDFGDSYAGSNASYWSATNTATYGSALSYVPEIPWNDSCASVLIATVEGYASTWGSAGFCNSATGRAYFLTTASGSGGPSGCASGAPSTGGVVSGSCKGYAKPAWQALVGNPRDGVRDIPDVSLFAANGVWGHYYVFCDSDLADGGAPCSGAPSGWAGAGGTSFASPIMAGIQALVNQVHGAQGNPNPVY
ncbi:MAG: hypothetical protein JO370_17975, partial [Paucibacter sp.]|nr:hypothetical protein [Roseateles sp.]